MKVPFLFRPFHGYSTTRSELAIIYLGAVAFASLVLFSMHETLTELTPLKVAILLVISLDLAGGAIANLCQGTRTFWRSRPVSLRLIFLAVHVIQAIGIAYVFPEAAASAALAYLWMLVAGSILILTGNTSVPLALALVLVGGAAINLPQGQVPTGTALLCVFLIKLVFSFSGGPLPLKRTS